MKRLIGFPLALVLASAAHAADPIPFGRGSWAELTARHKGQATIVHFWGLTCAPCLVEMPNWGALAAQRPDMKLVLIAADPMPQSPAQVQAAVERAKLDGIESWNFTDRFYERLRYEIDPAWMGELPRTVMIDRDGKPTVLNGVADLDKVRAWLDANRL